MIVTRLPAPRLPIRLAACAAVVCLVACLAVSLAACLPDPAPPVASERAPTEVYRTVGERELEIHFVRPPAASEPGEALPAILLFHGGGWVAGMPEWVYDAAYRFAGHGLLALPVEYRLSENGDTPIEAVEDACAAFRWVRENAGRLGVDPDRLAGYGESAGGHLVASVGTVGCPQISEDGSEGVRPEPDLLLLLSPALEMGPPDYIAKLLRGRAEESDYSPIEHARTTTPPSHIVHGSEDNLTPVSGARDYCAALRALGVACELQVYDGLDHMLKANRGRLGDPDYRIDEEAAADAFARQVEFLRQHGFLDG